MRQGFPVLTPHVGVAATLADRAVSLDGIDTRALDSGQFAVVTSGALDGNLYRLDITSAAAPDGTTIIAPLVGPGRWLLFDGGAGIAESSDYVTRPEWLNATTTRQAQANFEGGSYFVERPVSFNRVGFSINSRVLPYTGVIAIYQHDDGAVKNNVPLIAEVTFSDLSGRQTLPLDGGGDASLVTGVYWLLFGQSAGGGSVTLVTYNISSAPIINNQVQAGEHPCAFTTTVAAAGGAPATIDPFQGGADGFNDSGLDLPLVARLLEV